MTVLRVLVDIPDWEEPPELRPGVEVEVEVDVIVVREPSLLVRVTTITVVATTGRAEDWVELLVLVLETVLGPLLLCALDDVDSGAEDEEVEGGWEEVDDVDESSVVWADDEDVVCSSELVDSGELLEGDEEGDGVSIEVEDGLGEEIETGVVVELLSAAGLSGKSPNCRAARDRISTLFASSHEA